MADATGREHVEEVRFNLFRVMWQLLRELSAGAGVLQRELPAMS